MKKLLIISLMAIAIHIQAQNVGIGTPTPSAKLEVVGAGNTSASNTFLLKNSSASNLLRMQDNGHLFVGEPTVADIRQYKFRIESGDKGSLFIENPIISGNATVRILRGIPEATTINTTALFVQASSDNAGIFIGRGGIEATSTFSGNAAGSFSAAPSGNAVITSGKVAIFQNFSTPASGALLEVNGDTKITGEVNRPSTGTANMVPVAYGVVNSLGGIDSGSGNFTVSYLAIDNSYTVRINGETDHQNYTCSVIARGSSPKFTMIDPGIIGIDITIQTSTGLQIPNGFHFIFYKP